MGAMVPPPGQPMPMQPDEFTGASQANIVSFNHTNLSPPSTLYIGRDDQLVITAATSRPLEVVTVNWRLMLPSGVITVGQKAVSPASNRSVSTVSVPLAEGFLLTLSATAAVAVTRGQTFLRAFINRGSFGSGQPGQQLVSDYVTTQYGPTFPGGRIISPNEGPGFIAQYGLTPPGAGLEQSIIPPSNARWYLRAYSIVFTTGATVANRTVTMQSAGQITFGLQVPALINQAASTVVTYSGTAIGPWASPNTARAVLPIPPNCILIASGPIQYELVIGADNLTATDAFTSCFVDVEEWLDNV